MERTRPAPSPFFAFQLVLCVYVAGVESLVFVVVVVVVMVVMRLWCGWCVLRDALKQHEGQHEVCNA